MYLTILNDIMWKLSYQRKHHFEQLVLANPGPIVIDKLHTSNFAALLGEDKIFLTVAEAVAYCSPKLAEDP